MGLFCPSLKGYLMIRLNNYPILVCVIYDGTICSKTPFNGLAPIKEVKEVLINISFNIVHRYQECALHGK